MLLSQESAIKKLSLDKWVQNSLHNIHLSWRLSNYSNNSLSLLKRINKTLVDYCIKIIRIDPSEEEISIILECRDNKFVELIINNREDKPNSTKINLVYSKSIYGNPL